MRHSQLLHLPLGCVAAGVIALALTLALDPPILPPGGVSSGDVVLQCGGGKLKLKAKVLDVKAGGVKKRKKRRDTQEQLRLLIELREENEREGGNFASVADPGSERGDGDDGGCEEGSHKQSARAMDDHMMPAERRFHE